MKKISLFVLLVCCCCKTKEKNKNLTEEEVEIIETTLLNVKNVCFDELLYESKQTTYKRMGIKDSTLINEYKIIKNLTRFHYTQKEFINLLEFSNDKNRKILIDRWLNKKEYIPIVNPPDYPDGSLDLVRALDFYNSDDMKKYLDSIRQIEYKKLISEKSK